jgi:hypothetical protein
MNHSDAQFEDLLIDGQSVKIPTMLEWQEIARSGGFLDVPVYSVFTKNTVIRQLDFVLLHAEEFLLGVVRVRGLKSWVVLPLLRLDGRLQRVQIERLTCDNCGRKLKVANPSEPTLYFGAPDHHGALQDALKLRHVACPNCGAPLPKAAAWAELLPATSL